MCWPGWCAFHAVLSFVSDSRDRERQGPEEVHRSGLPERVRQDQPGHDELEPAGVQDHLRGRRHRLDALRQQRQAARHQPRGRLLRRGARYELKTKHFYNNSRDVVTNWQNVQQ